MSAPPRLQSDDIVSGFIAGASPRRLGPGLGSPSEALACALRPALERPPCLVAFSGGRDSSLLLAAAVREARRAGLPTPIPATLRFDSEATREDSWQRLVVDHLGLSEWITCAQGDELDLVGPIAAEGLRRHGVLYPANVHMAVPLARAGQGGSLVIGVGGDELLGKWWFAGVAGLLARRRAPRASDLRHTALTLAPHAVRVSRHRHGNPWTDLPWVREPERRRIATRIAAELTGGPRGWQARTRWQAQRRVWEVSDRSAKLLGDDAGVAVHHPLLDPGFLASLGHAGGRLGWGYRAEVLRGAFGDLLPSEIIERGTKAEFHEPYFGAHTRRFADAWDGVTGIDPQLVDGEALRAEWLAAHPSALSATLLQAVWLAVHRSMPAPEVGGA